VQKFVLWRVSQIWYSLKCLFNYSKSSSKQADRHWTTYMKCSPCPTHSFCLVLDASSNISTSCSTSTPTTFKVILQQRATQILYLLTYTLQMIHILTLVTNNRSISGHFRSLDLAFSAVTVNCFSVNWHTHKQTYVDNITWMSVHIRSLKHTTYGRAAWV